MFSISGRRERVINRIITDFGIINCNCYSCYFVVELLIKKKKRDECKSEKILKSSVKKKKLNLILHCIPNWGIKFQKCVPVCNVLKNF